MMYIIPYYSSLESEINEIKEVRGRLRAFPALRQDFKIYNKEEYPYITKFSEHVEKIILDSGAFALSTVKRKIDKTYLTALEQYYFYNSDERCICVAPDEFLNPVQSMYNFQKWQSFSEIKVAGVLQAEKKGVINIYNLMKQAEFYRKYTDTIFFSNPALTGETAKNMKIQKLFKFMKKDLKVKWIHNLGAGWSLKDIKDWKKIGYFDSMDSIAYYTTTDSIEFGSLIPVQNIHNILGVMKNETV